MSRRKGLSDEEYQAERARWTERSLARQVDRAYWAWARRRPELAFDVAEHDRRSAASEKTNANRNAKRKAKR